MDLMELKLCDVQGRLFELSVDQGLDSEDFVKAFMNSQVAGHLDSSFSHYQWAGEEYLLEAMSYDYDLKKSDKRLEKDIMYWIGYQYRYWSILRQLSSRKVYKQAGYKTMKKNYLMLHTTDPELAVEDLEEIYRQKNHKM